MAERRRFPRYQFHGTAGLTAGGKGQVVPVTVVSLSIDGCRVLGQDLPLRGERCQLKLQEHGKEFRAGCEITWHGQDIAGLKFIGVDEQSMEALRQICKGLNLEPLQPPAVPEAPRPK
jgi:hypothetical protein